VARNSHRLTFWLGDSNDQCRGRCCYPALLPTGRLVNPCAMAAARSVELVLPARSSRGRTAAFGSDRIDLLHCGVRDDRLNDCHANTEARQEALSEQKCPYDNDLIFAASAYKIENWGMSKSIFGKILVRCERPNILSSAL